MYHFKYFSILSLLFFSLISNEVVAQESKNRLYIQEQIAVDVLQEQQSLLQNKKNTLRSISFGKSRLYTLSMDSIIKSENVRQKRKKARPYFEGSPLARAYFKKYKKANVAKWVSLGGTYISCIGLIAGGYSSLLGGRNGGEIMTLSKIGVGVFGGLTITFGSLQRKSKKNAVEAYNKRKPKF